MRVTPGETLDSNVQIYEPKIELYILSLTLFETFTYCAPFLIIKSVPWCLKETSVTYFLTPRTKKHNTFLILSKALVQTLCFTQILNFPILLEHHIIQTLYKLLTFSICYHSHTLQRQLESLTRSNTSVFLGEKNGGVIHLYDTVYNIYNLKQTNKQTNSVEEDAPVTHCA